MVSQGHQFTVLLVEKDCDEPAQSMRTEAVIGQNAMIVTHRIHEGNKVKRRMGKEALAMKKCRNVLITGNDVDYIIC